MTPVFSRSVIVGTTSIEVLTENARRAYVLLVNNSDSNMHFNFDTPATSNSPLLNGYGGSFEFHVKDIPHTGRIYVLSDAATKVLAVMEISY